MLVIRYFNKGQILHYSILATLTVLISHYSLKSYDVANNVHIHITNIWIIRHAINEVTYILSLK